MILNNSNLSPQSLSGQIALVTGAGRGIGFETARSLIWLGAKVVLAEIDKSTGKSAEKQLCDEFGDGWAVFVPTDISKVRQVENLKRKAESLFGKVDIVINNATITPMGAVQDVVIDDWDASYGVNLRAPVLLAQAFLPRMLVRDYGVFICVSSVGEAYMGAYESFKAAQVHLANTLDAELQGTGVHAFTIGPGLVQTPGAEDGIRQLAPLYGKTVEEFYALSEAHIISVEEAGAGFAAAAALAAQFRGQEIGSKQALTAAGVILEDQPTSALSLSPEKKANALELCRLVSQTLKEQSDGWQERSMFERQWMLRDFKKNAGRTVEQCLTQLSELEDALNTTNPPSSSAAAHLSKLEKYYQHLQGLASGYEKNPEILKEQLAVIQTWRDDINHLTALLNG